MSTQETKTATPLVFYVNCKRVVEPRPDPEETVLSYLRRKLHLTGTKLTCGEGGCGACTVTVSEWSTVTNRPQHRAVNACLMPLCCLHGCSVTTVEGVGTSDQLHPVQERIAKGHGSQCGFCTPGIVMATYTELVSNPAACQADIEDAVQANLCRCTGYRPILQAVRSLGSDWQPQQQQSSDRAMQLLDFADCQKWNPSMEPEFPEELRAEKWRRSDLCFSTSRVTWYRPSSLRRLLELKQQHPQAKIINGNTEVGLETSQKHQHYTHLIHAGNIAELTTIEVTDNGLVLGAAVTLSQLLHQCQQLLQQQEFAERKKRTARALVDMLQLFAGRQIRDVAAVGGNIMTASPISDLIPLLMAAGSEVTLASVDGERRAALAGSFFVGYRRTATSGNELLRSIFVPFCSEQQRLFFFKQSRRRDDDIATVNAAMSATFDASQTSVADARLCFGGVSPTPVVAAATSRLLAGRPWDKDLLSDALASLATELRLASNAPGGQAEYRAALVASFFHRFFHRVAATLPSLPSTVVVDESATESLERRPVSASQLFDVVPDGQLQADPVGRPIVHASALKQTTGEAEYVDDMMELDGELFLAPVMSQQASASVESIDYSAALSVDGAVGVLDRRDVVGRNAYGHVDDDERVFAEGSVRFVGEFVAAVLATSREAARRAASLVQVTYADLPAVVTISEAAAAGSFFEEDHKFFEAGDVEAAFADAAFVVSDEVKVGGQEHFYLEPFSCLVVPKDGGQELEVFASTQGPTQTQEAVHKVTGLPLSRVAVRVKRIGGGFGGKETRCNQLYTAAAVGAVKFKRPVRAVLDRWEDMQVSGGRNPVRATYQLAAGADGRLLGLRVRALMNAGCTIDLSGAVAGRMLRSMLDTYRLGSVSISIQVCRTNTTSNTAFRAFGVPQTCAILETAMSHLAVVMGSQQNELRERNFYDVGETTLGGAVVKSDNLRRCWSECLRVSDYDRRLAEVKSFNDTSRSKKRGLAVSPISYGIGMGFSSAHQAGAIVNVYLDGSVLVTHSGVEMGQGLHTKLLQVASRVLGIPMSGIFISETATDKVPNTTPSAASVTTDLNAPAVMDACQQLKDRLAEFMHADPKAGWTSWVGAAYKAGVSLSANGFSHSPANEDAHPRSATGDSVLYYTYGAACSEVEIDCLTGDHVVLRSDIVVDLGASLNPAVDIGQVEGAFVQGCGLYTVEDVRHSPDGRLLTCGPGAYKIPTCSDIPRCLNVHLLRGSLCESPRAVYSSKAVGEPPLNLAVSVLQAIRCAVAEARRQAGEEREHFTLHSPATAERIRLACAGRLLQPNATMKVAGPEWEVRLTD